MKKFMFLKHRTFLLRELESMIVKLHCWFLKVGTHENLKKSCLAYTKIGTCLTLVSTVPGLTLSLVALGLLAYVTLVLQVAFRMPYSINAVHVRKA